MIDCKAYADEILDSVTGYGHLAVISVGNDPASRSYIKGKKHDCDRVGFDFEHFWFPEEAEQNDIIQLIEELNADEEVTGIIVQLPLPPHLDSDAICQSIFAEKDVDGFRPDSPFKPCTPEGIVYLLKKELGDLTGKHAVIIGRGKLVGKPLSKMLLDENMTVTVCHSKTREGVLYQLANGADAVIVAAGVPRYFKFYCISKRTVVVDCGIHRMENGSLCGAVGFVITDNATPVPGGVGLLTRAMLIKHVERKNVK